MKRISLFFILFQLINFDFVGQNLIYNWSNGPGASGGSYVYDMKIDEFGNKYIVGSFNGTVDFDPGPGTYNLSGNGGVFFAKYNSSDNLLFAKSFSSVGSFGGGNGKSIVFDASKNIYICGSYQNSIDADPGPGVATLTMTCCGWEGFVAKYDPNGNYLFAFKLGGNANDEVFSIELDKSNGLYVSGYFETTVDFDPGPSTFNLTSSGSDDIFFAKYDLNGNFKFAKKIGSTNSEKVFDLAIDKRNNICITGTINTTSIDFDPGVGTQTISSPYSNQDVFFAKYDSLGNYIFAKSIGSNGIFDNCRSIATDPSCNVYITGSYSGISNDFDPGPGIVTLPSVFGSQEVFIAKYDSLGNIKYAKGIYGTSDEYGLSIITDSLENVHIAGVYYMNGADYDPGPSTYTLAYSGGNSDAFFAKYDVNGNFIYAKNISGSKDEVPYTITLDANLNAHVSGFILGKNIDFDASASNALLDGIGNSGFFAKYDLNGNYVKANNFSCIDGSSHSITKDLQVDTSGAVIAIATFSGSINTTTVLNSNGANDILFSKYSPSGNFIFSGSIGGTGNDQGNAITSDNSDNIYITGGFQGSNIDFDIKLGISNMSSSGLSDIFFAKYDATGNFIFSKKIGGTLDDIGREIHVDSLGNIYIIGYFQGTNVDFDPGPGSALLSSTGNYDIFFAKYDNSGNYLFAKSFGSTVNDQPTSFAVDKQGNIYLTGFFQGTSDFDPGIGTANLSSGGSSDIFFAKYDFNGNYVFAKKIGATQNDQGNALVIDTKKNIYLAGTFNGLVDFDPSASAYLLSGLNNDIFNAKFDSTGNFIYANKIGGSGDDGATSMDMDAAGNILLTGYFQGSNVDFNPGSSTNNLSSAGDYDFFYAKYNSSGGYLFAYSLGTTWTDSATCVSLNNKGDICFSGTFTGQVDFDVNSGTAYLSTSSYPSGFIAKYFHCNVTPPINSTPSSNLLICSGNTTSLSTIGSGNLNWFTVPSGGSIVGTGNVFTTPTLTTTTSFYVQDSTCNVSPRTAITVTVSTCTGINSNHSEDNLQVYPNPFNNKITVIYNGNKQNLQVFNALGSIVYSGFIEKEKIEIDLSKQPSGIYFIRTGNSTKKLIKE